MGVVGLFNNCKLTTCSGKRLEAISHAHIVLLMYKLITSAKEADIMSNCLTRDRGRRQRELNNNKTQRGKFQLRIMLKDIFGFAEHQEKGTFGLRYNLTLSRNTDNAVLNKANAITSAKSKMKAFEWYVPQYTPSSTNQAILSKQTLSKTPKELQYVERYVFMKEVNT